MYLIQENQIWIMTDTLATYPDGKPYLFTSKCVAVPHLDMTVAFTGIKDVGQRWLNCLITSVLGKNIDTVNSFVPDQLSKITNNVEREFGKLPMTTTIYHFGYSEKSGGKYMGYAFRSEHGYSSELLANNAFGCKPQPTNPLEQAPTTIEEWVNMAKKLKQEQESRGESQRVFIGGDLILTVMNNQKILNEKVFKFDDFNSCWNDMNRNLRI